MTNKLYIVGLDGSADEYSPSVELPLLHYKKATDISLDARAFTTLEAAMVYQEEMRRKWEKKYTSYFIRIYEIMLG